MRISSVQNHFKVSGLARRVEFQKLTKSGRKFYKHNLAATVYFERSSEVLLIKAGYAVAKKSFPKAVTRNQIRRRLRAALRAALANLPALPNGTLLLKISPSIKIVQTSFQKLYSELREILNQGLFNE